MLCVCGEYQEYIPIEYIPYASYSIPQIFSCLLLLGLFLFLSLYAFIALILGGIKTKTNTNTQNQQTTNNDAWNKLKKTAINEIKNIIYDDSLKFCLDTKKVKEENIIKQINLAYVYNIKTLNIIKYAINNINIFEKAKEEHGAIDLSEINDFIKDKKRNIITIEDYITYCFYKMKKTSHWIHEAPRLRLVNV